MAQVTNHQLIKELRDLYCDLHEEAGKLKLLYYASDKADDNGDCSLEGLTPHIADANTRLVGLATRVEQVTIKMETAQAEV